MKTINYNNILCHRGRCEEWTNIQIDVKKLILETDMINNFGQIVLMFNA